jgi:DNA-binding MarR family transcriptional regulator
MLLSVVSAAGRDAWLLMTELLATGEARERAFDVSAAFGLSVGLLRALRELPDGEGVSMSKLAEDWRCDPSYVTGVIDQLESRGFAERRPHPTDRRIKQVVITAEGREARGRAGEMLATPPLAFDALSAAEQRQLRELMRKIAAANASIRASAAQHPESVKGARWNATSSKR